MDSAGNFHNYSVSGGVESVAPELYVTAGAAAATSKAAVNLATKARNMVLANPDKSRVAVIEATLF